MKRTTLIALAAIAIYIVGYGVVRLCYSDSGTRSWVDSQGSHEQRLKGTHFVLSERSLPRLSQQVLYWGFYPVGLIDQKITGREYGCVQNADRAL